MDEPNEHQDRKALQGRMTCMEPGCGATFMVRHDTDDRVLTALLDLHSRIHAIEKKGSNGRLA